MAQSSPVAAMTKQCAYGKLLYRALRNELQYCIAYLASGAARPVLRERERERERALLGNNVHDGGVQGAAR